MQTTKYKYKIETIKLGSSSNSSLEQELNDYGDKGWDIISVESKPYCDPALQLSRHRIQTHTAYRLIMKKSYTSLSCRTGPP